MQGLAADYDRRELAEGLRLAKKLNVVACDGGAGDEPCMFPRCLAHGCPGERPCKADGCREAAWLDHWLCAAHQIELNALNTPCDRIIALLGLA